MCLYQWEFVILGFFSIHFNITGLKNVVSYTRVILMQGFRGIKEHEPLIPN